MFRRRRILRPIAAAARAIPAAGGKQVHPELVRANELMQAGQYLQAAASFIRIAEVVRGRHGPRAPFFFLKAGHCYILADQVDEGMTCLRQGLGLLAGNGRWADLDRFGQVVVSHLNEKGYTAEAGEISSWLAGTLAGKPVVDASGGHKVERALLPTRCPSCGAMVVSREVDWIDDLTAECSYCGGPIRAESK